ncbi:MAG TPA: hypothetical protein VEO01_19585 [Pseudonocardiaceae bacterium]|nr:hypothetical protein [Pseudonocardiaceae bacterium]
MTAPLNIPHAATIAFRMGVAEVVAAELHRIADEHEPEANTEDYDQSEADQDEAVRGVCLSLRLRANELRRSVR